MASTKCVHFFKIELMYDKVIYELGPHLNNLNEKRSFFWVFEWTEAPVIQRKSKRWLWSGNEKFGIFSCLSENWLSVFSDTFSRCFNLNFKIRLKQNLTEQKHLLQTSQHSKVKFSSEFTSFCVRLRRQKKVFSFKPNQFWKKKQNGSSKENEYSSTLWRVVAVTCLAYSFAAVVLKKYVFKIDWHFRLIGSTLVSLLNLENS